MFKCLHLELPEAMMMDISGSEQSDCVGCWRASIAVLIQSIDAESIVSVEWYDFIIQAEPYNRHEPFSTYLFMDVGLSWMVIMILDGTVSAVAVTWLISDLTSCLLWRIPVRTQFSSQAELLQSPLTVRERKESFTVGMSEICAMPIDGAVLMH